MLDLYKLQIFTVVAQEGSFSAAADRLFVTQSAVSQHIKDLESSLGRQLFQRGWRGVKLTLHGEVLYDYAGDIFALVSKAENALTDVNQLESGRISIGATPGIGIYLAPDWVQQFRQCYPQLTVAVQTGITSQIVSDVLSQRLEIGFVEGELDDNLATRLQSIVLDNVEQQVVVGAGHPLWDSEKITMDDLREQSMIVRESSSQSRIWLEDVLRQHDIKPQIGAEFDNLESMKRGVSLGMCVAVLPPYVVQGEVERRSLHMIPVDGKPFTRTLKFIWDANTHFSPITRAFLIDLSERYPALGGLVEQDKN